MGADQVVLALRTASFTLWLPPMAGRSGPCVSVSDTSQLPVRLPPTGAHPRGRLLVLSADTRTLFALDLDGNQLWKYRLDAAALGRPVLLARRGGTVADRPTYDGTVHEIGLAEGRLLGRFRLGQPLSAGGVHQKGTDLVYFPADDSCVYVLNVATKKCAAILYTNHAAGSLRGEPLIVGGDERRGQDAGLPVAQPGRRPRHHRAAAVRSCRPPTAASRAVAMRTRPRHGRGWTWATPYQDGEKLVCLSERRPVGTLWHPASGQSRCTLLSPGSRGRGGARRPGLDGIAGQARGRAPRSLAGGPHPGRGTFGTGPRPLAAAGPASERPSGTEAGAPVEAAAGPWLAAARGPGRRGTGRPHDALPGDATAEAAGVPGDGHRPRSVRRSYWSRRPPHSVAAAARRGLPRVSLWWPAARC